MTPLEATSQIVGLTPGSIPSWSIALVGYLSEDGGEKVAAWMSPDMNFRDVIWALEELRFKLLTASNALE